MSFLTSQTVRSAHDGTRICLEEHSLVHLEWIDRCVCVWNPHPFRNHTEMCILQLTFKEYKVAAYVDPHTQTTLTGLCPFRGVERTPASDAGSISTTSARTHEPLGCATIVPLFGLAPSPARWASKAT